jgi:hypothetical protein
MEFYQCPRYLAIANSIQIKRQFHIDLANFNEFLPMYLGYVDITNSAGMSPHFPCTNIGSGQTSRPGVKTTRETNRIWEKPIPCLLPYWKCKHIYSQLSQAKVSKMLK